MLMYLFLFGLSFANDFTLTKYYIYVAQGKRWHCVGLALLQQLFSLTAVCYTLVDVEPLSREQFTRWAVTAFAYGSAAFFSVKPKAET